MRVKLRRRSGVVLGTKGLPAEAPVSIGLWAKLCPSKGSLLGGWTWGRIEAEATETKCVESDILYTRKHTYTKQQQLRSNVPVGSLNSSLTERMAAIGLSSDVPRRQARTILESKSKVTGTGR